MKLWKVMFASYFAATIIFLMCAWQADILNANLVYPVKDEMFDYWFHSWTKWTHYAWTFYGMALAFFTPLIVLCLYGITQRERGET